MTATTLQYPQAMGEGCCLWAMCLMTGVPLARLPLQTCFRERNLAVLWVGSPWCCQGIVRVTQLKMTFKPSTVSHSEILATWEVEVRRIEV
jgi:ABC-type spermidine/putrescine transport system permease subunit I